MNIVDNYTNKPWSIPLKTKSDSFNELKAWILAQENETGQRLMILHTGKDGKLNGDNHKRWYKEKGIILEVGAIHISSHRMCRTYALYTDGKGVHNEISSKMPSFPVSTRPYKL